MAVVKVPRTPKSSFNKDRRPSALLLDQIEHLEWAALPASQRKPAQLKKYRKVKTEAQAAERIAQLTKMVLETKEREVAVPPPADGMQPKVVLPPLPKITRRKSTAKKKRRETPVRRGKRRLGGRYR